jgi:hypothetical protein
MTSGDEWVTWPQAAEIVGCPVPTIDWYTRNGRIEKRPFRGPRPTLKRTSVEEFARWWGERQRARERRRLQQVRAKERRRRVQVQPPAPTGWMSTSDAADVLGVTASHVVWLVGRGHLEAHRRPESVLGADQFRAIADPPPPRRGEVDLSRCRGSARRLQPRDHPAGRGQEADRPAASRTTAAFPLQGLRSRLPARASGVQQSGVREPVSVSLPT